MVPLIDRVGESVGRLWAVALVWGAELALLLPVVVGLRKLILPRGRADLLALGGAGVFEVGGFICLSLGLGAATVTIVSPAASLSTLGSVALGVLLLRERVARPALVGALVASVGVVVINL